jgi:hypothetical protein
VTSLPEEEKTYHPSVRVRVKRLFEALLTYANHECTDGDILQITVTWQSENKLVVRTKLHILENLTERDLYPGKLTKDQIREALQNLENFLEILTANEIDPAGDEDWHFTLEVWHGNDTEANLKQFDLEWHQRHTNDPEYLI